MSYNKLNKLLETKAKQIKKLFNCSFAVYPKMEEYPNINIYFTKDTNTKVNFNNTLSIERIKEL